MLGGPPTGGACARVQAVAINATIRAKNLPKNALSSIFMFFSNKNQANRDLIVSLYPMDLGLVNIIITLL